jgi:hypothetical protein
MLLLAGCTSTAPTEETTPSSAPTPTYATENQVASVIATYATDWRETMDGAGECRAQWTFDPGSMTGATCWLTEQTLVTTAEITVRDLDALDIPPSLASLSESTRAILQGIVDVDAKTICGDGIADPIESPECNAALGSLNFYYSTLGNELDSWGPYL